MLSCPSLTRISVALGLCVHSCLGRWNARHSGSHPSASPTGPQLDVVQLVKSYKKQFQDAQPIDGDGVNYKAIVVAFTDLSADRAKDFFDEVLKQLAVPSYADDGLVLGAFYEGNQGTAIYNRSFRPFTPPVPFLLMRHAVVSDWKFFLDDRDWLDLWAKRYGASGVHALAEELRRLPWRETRD